MKKKILKGTLLEGTRVDQRTTPKWWKKVRNIAGIIAGIGAAALTTISTAGIALPAGVVTGITIATLISGSISGGAALTKEKANKPI